MSIDRSRKDHRPDDLTTNANVAINAVLSKVRKPAGMSDEAFRNAILNSLALERRDGEYVIPENVNSIQSRVDAVAQANSSDQKLASLDGMFLASTTAGEAIAADTIADHLATEAIIDAVIPDFDMDGMNFCTRGDKRILYNTVQDAKIDVKRIFSDLPQKEQAGMVQFAVASGATLSNRDKRQLQANTKETLQAMERIRKIPDAKEKFERHMREGRAGEAAGTLYDHDEKLRRRIDEQWRHRHDPDSTDPRDHYMRHTEKAFHHLGRHEKLFNMEEPQAGRDHRRRSNLNTAIGGADNPTPKSDIRHIPPTQAPRHSFSPTG